MAIGPDRWSMLYAIPPMTSLWVIPPSVSLANSLFFREIDEKNEHRMRIDGEQFTLDERRSGCERSEFPDNFIPRTSNPGCQVTPAAQPDLQIAKGINNLPMDAYPFGEPLLI